MWVTMIKDRHFHVLFLKKTPLLVKKPISGQDLVIIAKTGITVKINK